MALYRALSRVRSLSSLAATRESLRKAWHGVQWHDPYDWLRNRDNAAVISYLQDENRYAQSVMAGSKELQRQLREEMARRMEKETASPPERWGDWLYFVHIPQGKEFPVYSRRKAHKDRTWRGVFKEFLGRNVQVLIDINALADKHGYAHLGVFKLSKDHKLLAYTMDLTGCEVFTLFIKDLETGSLLKEHTIEGVVSVEWSDTGQYVYYTVANAARRPHRVVLRNLRSGEQDLVVFDDEDPKNFVDVTRTKDWQYILVNVNSKTTSELCTKVFLVDSRAAPSELRSVESRIDGVQYFVEHNDGYLYILTNFLNDRSLACGGHNYRVVRCECERLSSKSWEEIVPVNDEYWIEDMDIFKKYLVLYRRRNGLPTVQIFDIDNVNHHPWTVKLPPDITNVTAGANSDFDSSTLRLSVSSLVRPEATYDVDLTTGEMTLLQQVKISEVNTDSYTVEHLTATSHDKTRVPLTIVYSNKCVRQGVNAALVTGYGAYGELMDLSFSSDRLSLLDRGFVLAFAHVRGGGTLGKVWHKEGKLLKKKNSFEDFLACVEYLVENRYASCEKIAAFGESAGGLLVAAAVNMRPEAFGAVILKVPFLDILNTMLDSSLSLTEHEYDEWGDPSSDKVFFDYIRSYSPYDNIKGDANYPAMLVTSSFLDTRVGYWESAKWIAALRQQQFKNSKKSKRPILLKTSMKSGHFGDGGRYSHLRDTAYEYAFLINSLSIS